MTPQEIVSELDRHIVGQAAAKRAVAIAMRNRWRRQQVAEPMRGDQRAAMPADHRADLVAKCIHPKDLFRLDDIHGLDRDAQHRKSGPNQSFDVAVQNADDQPAARLVDVGEDDAGQFEQRQQTLVLCFEVRPALGFQGRSTERPSRGERQDAGDG